MMSDLQNSEGVNTGVNISGSIWFHVLDPIGSLGAYIHQQTKAVGQSIYALDCGHPSCRMALRCKMGPARRDVLASLGVFNMTLP